MVHWFILDESTNTLLHEGTISDPNFDFYYPSIAANANGDFVIGFNRSGGASTGADGYISSFAEVCSTVANVVTCENPLLLAAGAANATLSFRWGDYSATTIDPTDPFAFWTVQEIPVDPNNSNIWGTQITEIRIEPSAVSEPGTLLLLLPTALLAWVRAARQRTARS